jgi:hypothetical protein
MRLKGSMRHSAGFMTARWTDRNTLTRARESFKRELLKRELTHLMRKALNANA